MSKVIEPRRYQLEILEYVCSRNAVIYLPTGAGKTFIAILALRRYSHTMKETIENGGKRAVFMCNTVELARQQALDIKNCTNLKVGLYTGERDVDNWPRSKWQTEITENQVLVGTAQIFCDVVTQNYIKITDLSIVIIDECHNATKNHPMHIFMSLFQHADRTELPRVIGLTGVLIKGNKLNNVQQQLENLERVIRGKIITAKSVEEFQNIMLYSTKPKEELITYMSNQHRFQIESKIDDLIEECQGIVENWDIGTTSTRLSKGLTRQREPSKKTSILNLLKDFKYQMADMGLYGAAIAIMSVIAQFEIAKRQAETLSLRYLYRCVITRCEHIRHILVHQLKDMVDTDTDTDTDDDDPDADADAGADDADDKGANVNDAVCHTIDVILNFSTPKVRSLLGHMKKHFAGKRAEEICCLVFVERRYTAKCLYYILSKYIELTPELKNILKPQFMVGRNSILYSIENVLERKWNQKTLNQFKSKECNLIVCSNVLEEGIDIQACNTVYVFDPLKTFSSYIQTKGRARSNEANYLLLASKIDHLETVEKIRKYQSIHETIKKYLITRTLECSDPRDDEIGQEFVDLIPPFVIPSGARLLASNVLSLIYRYAQMLPWDSFGCMLPWFCKLPLTDNGKCAVTLRLPLQSTVREIITSDFMDNAKQAKISAAFKACVKLYEQGELNDHLLPITKTECVAKVSEEFFDHWKQYDDDVIHKISGKENQRLYQRKCPDELYDALPRVGETCYAYAIHFFPEFEENPYNAYVRKFLNDKCTYALLLRKQLPKLAEMPLFMSQGKLHVKISDEPIECCIGSAEELEQLRNFHTMIFRDLLMLWKNFFVKDHRNKENSYLIVPLNAAQCIDWQLVESFQRLEPLRKDSSPADCGQRVYRAEDYLNKIVTKCYVDKGERFVVTKVRRDLSPRSPMETQTYETYEQFFSRRYDVTVVNKTQFLLEVRELTSRRNFFINAVGKSKAISKEHNPIILIPELCHNFRYPGSMWLKALFLPTILFRVYFMLHADHLRRRINRFLDFDDSSGNTCVQYTPKPLIIDPSLKRAVGLDGVLVEKVENAKKSSFSSPLPPKQCAEEFTVQSLMGDDMAWKDYMEPIDYSRKLQGLFPVEIDYYHKFIMASEELFEEWKLKDDDIWSTSQLSMPSQKHTTAKLLNTKLSLSDVPKAEKLHIEIEILARSFGDAPMTSAEQCEFLAAITTAAVNDVFDMERFELLGDSFLKFAASLYLTNKYPKFNEGFLTTIKSRLVSNRNLLYLMLGTDIPQRISAAQFQPSILWLPPLVSLPENLLELLQRYPLLSATPAEFHKIELSEDEICSGTCSPKIMDEFVDYCDRNDKLSKAGVELSLNDEMNAYTYRDVLHNKVVADTLEAILGVCVKNYGIHRGFRMLEFFKIFKADPKMPLTNLLDLKLEGTSLHTNISTEEVDDFLINHQSLESNLGYTFRNRAYLLRALTHPSYPANRITGCYQELEFIGDAILDFLVTCYIFERYKDMTPGMLTDMRSALVNNITLACVCVRHRFHLFLLAENSALSESIKTFAEFQKTQDYSVTDQVRILMEEIPEMDDYNDDSDERIDENGGAKETDYAYASSFRPAKSFNMSENIDVPKALGDIVEALIAAVYLDSRDLYRTWQVVYGLLEQEFNQFSHHVPIDPVRQLQEYKHANPKYSAPIVDNNVVMMKCVFSCLDKLIEVNGFGSNARNAKKSAAKHALQILAKHSN